MITHTHEELRKKLSDYQQWKICLTDLCGIPLTSEYIEKRISELNDNSNLKTQKFIESWGEEHLVTTIRWFERAKNELKAEG